MKSWKSCTVWRGSLTTSYSSSSMFWSIVMDRLHSLISLGLYQGKPVDWMDAAGKEVTLWQSVIERSGLWFEGSLPLRTSMEQPIIEWIDVSPLKSIETQRNDTIIRLQFTVQTPPAHSFIRHIPHPADSSNEEDD